MSKYYEETLPESYREELVVDASDSQLSSKLARITTVINTALLLSLWFLYAKPMMADIKDSFSVWICIGFVASYFLYISLHELTHGIVYKLMTKKKLIFGIKPPVAYCGVPGIYAYRITAMMSLLAPFTVFSIVFVSAFFLASDAFLKIGILILFVLHLSGCSGDLYGLALYLFKFKDPLVLRMDTGPKQIYYVKDN